MTSLHRACRSAVMFMMKSCAERSGPGGVWSSEGERCTGIDVAPVLFPFRQRLHCLCLRKRPAVSRFYFAHWVLSLFHLLLRRFLQPPPRDVSIAVARRQPPDDPRRTLSLCDQVRVFCIATHGSHWAQIRLLLHGCPQHIIVLCLLRSGISQITEEK